MSYAWYAALAVAVLEVLSLFVIVWGIVQARRTTRVYGRVRNEVDAPLMTKA